MWLECRRETEHSGAYGYGAELEQAEPTLVARAALVDDVVGAADWILEQA